jgi:putative PIN family toxin of toxin-antitoxin system
VLDTDVVVAAMRSPRGGSAELLRRIERGDATIALTVALALEYEATCLRPEHQLASGLSEAEIRSYVTTLISFSDPVRPHFRWRPQLSDPGDELVLEAAINGHAEALITFNSKDFRGAEAFGLTVMRPGEALRRLKS